MMQLKLSVDVESTVQSMDITDVFLLWRSASERLDGFVKSNPLTHTEMELVRCLSHVNAVKAVRDRMGCGLAIAKLLCDRYRTEVQGSASKKEIQDKLIRDMEARLQQMLSNMRYDYQV
jgi:ribosomal protein L7/L12